MPLFRRPLSPLHYVALVMTLVALCLLIALIAVSFKETAGTVRTCGSQDNGRSPVSGGIIEDVEPGQPGPFHDLTTAELEILRSFLESDIEINATKLSTETPLGQSALVQSYVSAVDLYLPTKADVLAHVDQGHQQPPREALVVLFRGDKSPAVIEERVCGPLPDVTSCRLLKSSKRRNPVEFSLRPFNMMEFGALKEVLLAEVVEKKVINS